MNSMYWERIDRDGLCSAMLWPDWKMGDEQATLITRIITTAKYRGLGYARKVMERLLADADAEQVTLVLEVVPEGRDEDPGYDQLCDWYERLGFVWDDTIAGMRRRPR